MTTRKFLLLLSGSACFGVAGVLLVDIIFNRPVAVECESQDEVIEAITQQLDQSEVLYFAESNTDPWRGTERSKEDAQ